MGRVIKIPKVAKSQWLFYCDEKSSGMADYIDFWTYDPSDLINDETNPYEHMYTKGRWYLDTDRKKGYHYTRIRIEFSKSQGCGNEEFTVDSDLYSLYLNKAYYSTQADTLNARNPELPSSIHFVQADKLKMIQMANEHLKRRGYDCTIEFEGDAPECGGVRPDISELLKAENKKHFVIAKPKGRLSHALYLFNPDLTDIVYSTPQDPRSRITALNNVPMYTVVNCEWQKVGKANLRFSDCNDDMCEDTAGIISNGLDPLIISKIGTIQKGNEKSFLNKKFPTCCVPPTDKDSSLSGPIKDLLDKHGKTFYLLGKEEGQPQHKLYLFNLGDVVGTGLTYTAIQKAVCYIQESCQWKLESENATFKFSKARDDIDTNFYLLTIDKLGHPAPNVGTITHRKANEFLLKKFPTCNVTRPEGGPNPDDTLKPDFGGGGGGDRPPDDGSGGLFPEHNNPLPPPEIPPCGGGDGSGQTPVSEIKLLQVPELSPSYENTYDFDSKSAQETFFKNKPSASVYKYSYLRKDQVIQIGSHVDNIHCYNYLMYKNKFGKWYYCFIMRKEYVNERTTRIYITTDVIQTYLFDYTVGPSYVERCHVPRWKSGEPTPEYEPEGLEIGSPIQVESNPFDFVFQDSYIAVCSNPLGEIPSRSVLKKKE